MAASLAESSSAPANAWLNALLPQLMHAHNGLDNWAVMVLHALHLSIACSPTQNKCVIASYIDVPLDIATAQSFATIR